MRLRHRRPVRSSVAFDRLESRLLYAFGVSNGTAVTGQPTYVIDNGGDLKFSVIKGGSISNTLHLADVSSIQYKGKELLASYASASRYSHYEQGLGSDTQITTVVNTAAGWIMVKCLDTTLAADGVTVIPDPASATQYYLVRRNDNNLYMASLPNDVYGAGSPGEGRFIAYLSRSVFATPEIGSDNAPHSASDTVNAIEGSDVFGHTDGTANQSNTTSSKFFNMGRRMIENTVHGVVGSASGTTVGAYMNMGTREHSAGGPFFKDIDFQSSAGQVELYNVIFSGHTQTETYRQGLYTYAMQFTDGQAPAAPDYSWLDGVVDSGGATLISGYVPTIQRGAISGVATGNPAGSETVVTLTNASAQYWDMADAGGNYTITGVMPGTYTETMYRDELAVGTRTVTITAASTTQANLVNTYYTPTSTWRIGTWDGTPLGFLNTEIADVASGARKIEIMHPSDSRLSSWVLPADATTGVPTFNVGTNTDAQWPMIQFMGVNNSNRIAFNLTAAQAATAQTLRIGVTLGFEGGRNRVTVNNGNTGVTSYTSAIPTATRDLNSRGITRGTWRGDNQLYTYSIPTTALKAGLNWVDIGVVSGSYVAGQTWLSPNVVYDAIDLVPTSTASTPAIASVTVTPAATVVGTGGNKAYTAVAKDAAGNVVPANIDWSTAGGTLDANGNFVASTTPGSYTVTANVSRTQTAGYSTSSSSSSVRAASVTAAGSASVLVLANTARRIWYRANDTASTLTDSAGNNLNATLNGAAGFTTPAIDGTALKLTGGYAQLPNGITNGLEDFTVGTWVRPDSTATWQRIFDFGTGTTSYMFLTTKSETGNVRFAIKASAASAEQVINGPALAAGVWTHLAVTLSGNVATLYVNGVAYAANNAMTSHPSALGATTLNYLGKSQFTADPNYLGSLDDFRLYGSALSAGDVNAWFKSATAPAVVSTLVNDGSAQRSMVGSLRVNFNQPLSLAAGALTLNRRANGITPAASIGLVATPVAGTNNASYVLTFTGAGLTSGSLDDGVYDLVLTAAGATNELGLTPAANTTITFTRLFGDVDGDGGVSINDFNTFASAFGTTTGNAAYNGAFDSDNDGGISINDFNALASRFGTVLNTALPAAASKKTATVRKK